MRWWKHSTWKYTYRDDTYVDYYWEDYNHIIQSVNAVLIYKIYDVLDDILNDILEQRRK